MSQWKNSQMPWAHIMKLRLWCFMKRHRIGKRWLMIFSNTTRWFAGGSQGWQNTRNARHPGMFRQVYEPRGQSDPGGICPEQTGPYIFHRICSFPDPAAGIQGPGGTGGSFHLWCEFPGFRATRTWGWGAGGRIQRFCHPGQECGTDRDHGTICGFLEIKK